MCTAPGRPTFDESLADALEVGQRELATLNSIGERAIGAYHAAGTMVARDAETDGLLGQFAEIQQDFADRLAGHLAEQSNVLSTFNIAFFGRTGAGKSTLLSAFGELDGAGVSPGESDWTKTVKSIPWRGCRLYDTPGINGWGGRESRDTLEAAARKAVEIADVVLLCFDTQSQQASEFAKVADWVTHFGKPVIAVLNVRNPRWRHPARVPSQAARRNMSQSVAQHAENVRVELANIGLDDVPVVAISSRRALFARATTPFLGPATQNFHDDRDRYGIDYLARWSNFPALEDVLSASIAAGGAQLRLQSLREGVRSLLHDEAASIDELRGHILARIEELDGLTRRYLNVLGYLEPDDRATYLHDDVWHSDLLTLAESARQSRYPAAADGSLVRHVRNLLKPHLAEPRNNALRRFKDLEHKAFREGKTIDAETFTSQVFNDEEISGAVEEVCAEATAFLERELSLAGVELRTDRGATYEKTGLDGNAGDTASLFGDLLRGGGMAGGVAAVAAPLLFSNPLGWAAIAAGIGIGAAAAGLQFVGSHMSRSAAGDKAEAHAKATRSGRKAVDDTFDAIESEFCSRTSAGAWTAAAPLLRPVLVELIILTALRADTDTLVADLRAQASTITQTPPVHLLDVATKLLPGHSSTEFGKRRADAHLLGEDWFDHNDGFRESTVSDEDFAQFCRWRHDQDAAALRRAVQRAFACPDVAVVSAWQQHTARASESDECFAPVAAAALARPRPAVVVAGDYSAGKSSFIKRIMTEFGGDAPASLHIRADATTDEVHRYPLGRVDIVDTPGLQSRRAGHDGLALAGAQDAALVIVVLHVNLLIGDTTALQEISNGTSTAAGKWPRMLFVVNRCDELGVDPTDSTEEYFNRRDRKQTELAAALRSRGIDVAPSHIHGVAADPFGGVGTQIPVTEIDYAANRAWDGIAALVDALRSWADADLTHATTLVAFDDAFTQLLTLREHTHTGIATYTAETGKHDSLIAAMDICLEDANYLHRSLEHELAEVLARPAAQAIARIRTIGVGDEQGLAAAIHSWRSPETQSEMERFMKAATDKINDWSATHLSTISREENAAGFDTNLDLPGAVSAGGAADAVGRAAGAAGWAAGIGARLANVLGNREAALRIGHFFGHKFKPWGAIKAGKAVGRVGIVLGVVAVAADAATWANETNRARNWDARRDAAVDEVESDSRWVSQQLLADPEGPWTYLVERTQQVRSLRDQYRDRQRTAQDEAERLQQRLVVADDLVAAAEDIRKVTIDE